MLLICIAENGSDSTGTVRVDRLYHRVTRGHYGRRGGGNFYEATTLDIGSTACSSSSTVSTSWLALNDNTVSAGQLLLLMRLKFYLLPTTTLATLTTLGEYNQLLLVVATLAGLLARSAHLFHHQDVVVATTDRLSGDATQLQLLCDKLRAGNGRDGGRR